MKILIQIVLLFVAITGAKTQTHFTKGSFPELPISSSYSMKSGSELPSRVNNSDTKFFPEIINQYGWSCNQASSIGYVMTYEMNQIRDRDGKAWENLYTQLFPWNFLNRNNSSVGVSYFDTWEVVKAAGCPTYLDFANYNDTRLWMSGYDLYYKSMKNRVIDNYSIHVDTPEGLEKLKNYLLDHADGSTNGGIANIQVASSGMSFRNTPEDSPDPNYPIIISFGVNVGHALTIVGYDDNIGVDWNSDGQITNDIDINGDGEVDMADWEMGALFLANTWGKGWAHEGFTYLSYSALTRDGYEGGIWNKSVHVIKVVKEYEPVLTMKVVMDHSRRSKFRLLAGFAKDLEATEPEHIMGFPHFNYQGDEGPLFSDDPIDSTRFELGLDISSLTSFLTPGEPVKFFLLLDEKDPTDQGQGKIHSFSVFNYGEEPIEYVSEQNDIPIINDAVTTLSVVASEVIFNQIQVVPEPAESVPIGEVFTKQLQVNGGTPPYLWELVKDYSEVHFERVFPEFTGDTLVNSKNTEQFTWIKLPFKFPFYGEDYLELVVDKNGALHFNTAFYNYPYAIDTDMRFKVRRSLIPFGRDLFYTDVNDMICYQANDTVARILYNATVHYQDGEYDVQFGTYLYPDGRIEFHYGPFSQPSGGMYPWITGISNGDGRLYKHASVSELGILFQNYGVCFQPNEYPGEVNITDDGLLSCKPSYPDRIWNIYVQVRDKNNQIGIGAVPISTVNWDDTEILSSAYPNPFRGVTSINFKVPSEQLVNLRIYDISGRMVKDLVSEIKLTGEYTYYWNGSNFDNRDVVPGMYFYRLEIGEGAVTQKIVKVR